MAIGSKPNFAYLQDKVKISNGDELRNFIINSADAKKLDFVTLANDVESFLFFGDHKKRVVQFLDYLKTAEFYLPELQFSYLIKS